MKTFDITYNNQPVGKAKVSVEGLYYKVSCRCQLPEKVIYRIYLISGDVKLDLGICVPQDAYFVLNKKIPVKQIQKGEFSFYVYEKRNHEEIVRSIPVANNLPFSFIAQLEQARLEIRGNQHYIMFSDEFIYPK